MVGGRFGIVTHWENSGKDKVTERAGWEGLGVCGTWFKIENEKNKYSQYTT